MRSVKVEGKTNMLRHLKQFDDFNLQTLTWQINTTVALCLFDWG